MYFGGRDERAVQQAVGYVIDEAIDDAIAWNAQHITILVEQDNSFVISNDGPGLPLEIDRFQQNSRVELALTNGGLSNWTGRPHHLINVSAGCLYLH